MLTKFCRGRLSHSAMPELLAKKKYIDRINHCCRCLPHGHRHFHTLRTHLTHTPPPNVARSLLSSIHNNRAATAELKGDKQQESVIYSASRTKKVGGGHRTCAPALPPYLCHRLLVMCMVVRVRLPVCYYVWLSVCCCVWWSVCCCVWLSVCCCVWLCLVVLPYRAAAAPRTVASF